MRERAMKAFTQEKCILGLCLLKNPYVEVPAPSTSERVCIWRQGLAEASKLE
jgi:hypothetical protein